MIDVFCEFKKPIECDHTKPSGEEHLTEFSPLTQPGLLRRSWQVHQFTLRLGDKFFYRGTL
jgi:hypothetical protein